jgi:biopolymer transport protein ExbD
MNRKKNSAFAGFSLALMALLAAGSIESVTGLCVRQSANDTGSQSSTKIEIPKAVRPVCLPALSASAVVVTIPADEVFYFGNDKVDQIDLSSRIGRLFKDKAPDQQIVYVRCAGQVRYGSIMPLIETAFAAGAKQIFFLVKNDGPQNEPESICYLPFDRPEKIGDRYIPDLLVAEIKPETDSRTYYTTLNGARVRYDDLYGYLRTLFEFRSNRLLYVHPPPEVPYSKVIEVMDEARVGGAKPVILTWKGTFGEEVYPFPLPHKKSSAVTAPKKVIRRQSKSGSQKKPSVTR